MMREMLLLNYFDCEFRKIAHDGRVGEFIRFERPIFLMFTHRGQSYTDTAGIWVVRICLRSGSIYSSTFTKCCCTMTTTVVLDSTLPCLE